ncbi:hypothetical protein ACFE04_021034 [Oxalis oulophora]
MAATGVWGIMPLRRLDRYHSPDDTSLFSTSLPLLPHENFTDSDNSAPSIHDDNNSLTKVLKQNEDKDVFQGKLGNLLPDDDELFAGLMDDLDLTGLPTQMEDLEEYDLFGSGGGMELDFETQENLNMGMLKMNLSDGGVVNGMGNYTLSNTLGTVAGEHPYGEHPSRTLFVRNINSNVEDAELKTLFEQFGDIRTLYTACKHRGFVMISYYDIRAARTAMRALQNKPLRRRKLDIHFSIPKDNPSEKDVNQGTLVVFNLDPSVSNDDLRQIFGAYGVVKEIRETPHKRHHKFIEYYDVRDAETALKALNRSDIAGKRIKLEPSRPGGARRNLMQQLSHELELDDASRIRPNVGSPVASSPPGSWAQFGSPVEHSPVQSFSRSPGLGAFSPVNNNHLSGLASILPLQNSTKLPPIGKDQGRPYQIFTNSFPDHNLSSSPILNSGFKESNSSSGIETLSGPQFLWGSPRSSNSYSERASTSAWPTPPVGHPFSSNGNNQSFSYNTRHGSFLGSSHHHHHVGSAPSGVPLDRHFGYFPESPETSFLNQSAFGGVGLNHNNGNYMMHAPSHIGVQGNINENGSPSYRMLPRHTPMFLGNGFLPGPGSFEGLTERGRTRRVENGGNQIDSKKQYQLDLEKIMSGDDTRTTLMIKNIPNKYTSKMLLAAIDEYHSDTYDFLYLPIDFKNKCNVGYAFINMVSPSRIIAFYQAFNGKKWEKFNSEKVASLAYARIQGKNALVAHFQNSSLMNEDKRCRPIVFHAEGQENVDQDQFSGNLNICIRQPDGSYSGDLLDSPKGRLEEEDENF